MNKRAKEVADRFKTCQSDLRSFRGGRSSFYSGRRGFRSRIGGRSRFPLSRYRGAFDPPMPVDPPPPPLNPPGNWSVGVRVNIVPVGGRLSLFVAQAKHHSRPLYCFSSPPGFFRFQFKTIFRGCYGKSPYPSGIQKLT